MWHLSVHTLVREAAVLASRGSAHLANGHVMWSNAQEVAKQRAPGPIAKAARHTHKKKQTVELSLARLAEDLLHGLNWIYEKNGERIFLVDNADAA